MKLFKEQIITQVIVFIFAVLLLIVGIILKNLQDNQFLSIDYLIDNTEKEIKCFNKKRIPIDTVNCYSTIVFSNHKRKPIIDENIIIDFSKDSIKVKDQFFKNPHRKNLDSSNLVRKDYTVIYHIGKLIKDNPVTIFIITHGSIKEESINIIENLPYYCKVEINGELTNIPFFIKNLPYILIIISGILILGLIVKWRKHIKHIFSKSNNFGEHEKWDPKLNNKGLKKFLNNFFKKH